MWVCPTQVTVLQTWRSTAPTNKGWHRKKEDNGWSKETLGSQEELNQKHLCYARSLHPKRWGHVKWRAYEAAASFFSLAPQANSSNSPTTGPTGVGKPISYIIS